MILVLSLILLLLLVLTGGVHGLKTFCCFYLNYILIIVYLFFMRIGLNAIVLSLIMCILAALISLFMINGNNTKTRAAFASVCIILAFMFGIVFFIGKNANIQGFAQDSIDTIGSFSFDINYDMTDVIIGVVLICTIGTIIDTSISVSTALNEVYENNRTISLRELVRSGMNVGRDILSTTINTLFFAFLGGIIAFLFWHHYKSFEEIINYKSFVQEAVELLCCFIGSVLIIPITSYITSYTLLRHDKKIISIHDKDI